MMEPERPIEKMLREWAKKRRQDADSPPELHPATRRMLQSEVARKFGKNEPRTEKPPGWLISFWPRIAWALGVFAVLAVAAWLLLPPFGGRSNTGRLAKGESQPENGVSRRAPALQPTVPAAPAVEMARSARELARAENSPSPQEKGSLSGQAGQPAPDQTGA